MKPLVLLLLMLTGCAQLSAPPQSTVSVSMVTSEPFHIYDNQLTLEVTHRFGELIDAVSLPAAPGKVVVKFQIDSSGKITSPSIVLNESSEMLGLVCKRAILDPSPYPAWPPEMRERISSPRSMEAVFKL